jgi:catechol 2,3-dioxygenase-like lactoylglutathione lyase family enzyme
MTELNLRIADRLNHVAYPTFDTGETYRFYTEVMGFRLVYAAQGESESWGNKTFLHTLFVVGSGEAIAFFEVEGVDRPKQDGLPKDIRHLALSVASREDLESWKRRLEAHGVQVSDVVDHGGVHYSIYFSDPNDVEVELTYQVRAHDESDAVRALEVVRGWTAARGQRPVP